MTTKKLTEKNKITPVKKNGNTLNIMEEKGKSRERLLAELGLSPIMLNTKTAQYFNKYTMGETDLTETIGVMKDKVVKVNAGDLNALEATLTAQTVSLDAIFNELARRAALNMGEYINAAETYMRLALKAQTQCARTIEVIAAMKNPPIVYAKQMNVANGNQQVNNGNNASNTNSPAHTGKIINQPNELLEVNNGVKKMDGRTAQTTIPKDKAMATLEK